ncbi:unnamed protein product [Blepharisma stoltei]|uniref:Uncharacterized protein n=1 Tax=Blepharisma stoltei TaxID=1481888 RepID=A0AAU9IZA2_9CILI|nr:unnamed protein product [Blepharisma stoltei]
MFSKFGKVSNERFYILKYKDEIVSGKTRKISPKHSPIHFRKKQLSPENIMKLISTQTARENSSSPSPRRSYAFLSQTRQDFYKSTSLRSSAPPCGHYNLKYDLVEKSQRQVNFGERPRTSSKIPKTMKEESLNSSMDSQTKHIQTPILFEKQIARADFTKLTTDVNEKRFELFDSMPEQSSKYKRSTTPNISKSRPREYEYLKLAEYSPDYQPNYKLVTKSPGQAVKFENYIPHKPILLNHLTSTRNYHVKYGMVEKRVNSPNFNLMVSRPDSTSPLPLFMQQISSRVGLNVLNEKMLLMNSTIGPSQFSSPSRSPNLSVNL